jgi:hypothetical protein
MGMASNNIAPIAKVFISHSQTDFGLSLKLDAKWQHREHIEHEEVSRVEVSRVAAG